MVCAPAGTETFVPTASILPSRITTVPFSISGPLTVTIRALRIAKMPRGGSTPCCVVGFPICCATTEPAKRSSTVRLLICLSIARNHFYRIYMIVQDWHVNLRLFNLDIVILMSARAAARRLWRLALYRWFVRVRLLQGRTFLRELCTPRDVLFTIEVNDAIDE